MKKSIAKLPSSPLIVGLGNPGEEYKDTPHNAGFLVIDELLNGIGDMGYGIREKDDLKSELYEIKFGSKKLILAKPLTFMNNSGTAVKALVSSFKSQVSSLWLIHDDIDLELGKIKIVKNRGSGGHKGVEDVVKKLKTKNFVRFRIGTRPKQLPQKRSKSLMNKFVASGLGKSDQRLFKKSIGRARDAVLLALEQDIEKATSIYNVK